MEKSNIPEEVTITPVIRDIERLFLRLFTFIKTSLSFLVKQGIKFIQFCAKYFVLLILIAVVGGTIGFFSERFIPREFISTMIVKPSVNAKSQLQNDIFYINSLIEKEENEVLSNLFEISVEEAQTLTGMRVVSVTTEIERLRIINDFYKDLDSVIKNNFTVSRLLEDDNESIGKRFSITISGLDPTIFAKLESRFIEFLERVPELQKRRKVAIEILHQQKEFYIKQLNDLDTLKKVINTSKLAEAQKTETSSATSISLGPQQTSEAPNILDVYDRSRELFKEVIWVESKLFDLTTCYKIYAGFSEYGTTKGWGKFMRTLTLGGSLFVLALVFLGIINALSSLRKRDA